MSDPFNLQRFVDAQDPVYEQVCSELQQGNKTSHWIWFIFPQIEGLGRSSTAQKYAISSRQEAEAYLLHPILGARLRECTQFVNDVEGRSIEQILYYPDNLKFRSSMTLFADVADDDKIFIDAIEKYFSGEVDQLTLEKL